MWYWHWCLWKVRLILHSLKLIFIISIWLNHFYEVMSKIITNNWHLRKICNVLWVENKYIPIIPWKKIATSSNLIPHQECFYYVWCLCHLSEAATRGVLCKKVFLEISQNSQENTCARVSFLINLQAWGLAQVFSCEFCEISKNTFFTEHLWMTASHLCYRALTRDLLHFTC